MLLLAINSGSSTLKFRLYEMPEEKVITKGSFERIGSTDSDYTIRVNEEKVYVKKEIKTHKEAVDILLTELVEKGIVKKLSDIKAVGHRIVHGGALYSHSVIITDRVVSELENIQDLAPLHNPAALAGIKAFLEEIPTATMVACFDTAFHQTLEEKDFLYPVPYEWYVKYGVRKYGFHGLSHQYIASRMEKILGHSSNLIICHIGNGASVSAVKEGVCIDTSMGFTPNAGIMMGTRSGDIDYSFIGYVMKKTGLSFEEIDTILNKKSGLEGIAGMSDLRDIDRAYLAKENKVILAIDMYTERIAEYIAKYFLKLGKVDAIVFTAGGGENDPIIRKEVLNKLKPLGVELDEKLNEETIVRKDKEGLITTKNSSIASYVLATDEELVIARDTYNLSK